MKKINKIISAFIILMLFTIGLNISKVKAASASLTASASEITVGTTVTLTGTVTAGAWNLRISGNGVNQPLVGQISSPTGNETKSVSAAFTPTEPGTYTFTLSGDMTDFSADTAETVSQSVTVTVKEKEQEPPEETTDPGDNSGENTGNNNDDGGEQNNTPETNYPQETPPQETQVQETPKSSNNYLKSLSIGTGTLSPEFYRETYEYTVEFGEDINLYELANIEISAQAEDSRAKVEGAGTIELVEGDNSININVTAENGNVRTYTVKVVKPAKVEQSALRLTGVVINGIKEDGEFQSIEFDLDPEVFEYNLTVPYEINSLSINPTTENEDIIIEVTGADSLIEGQNKVLIILTSPSDETIKTTYTLNVERQAGLIQENNEGDRRQTGIIIIGGVVGGILLLIIIIAIVKHTKKKKSLEGTDDEDDFEIEDENQDNNKNFMKFSKNDNEDYEEDNEENYPFRGISKDKDLLERENKNEEKEEQSMPTTDDIENPKLRWDDFINSNDDEEESSPTKKKSKHGKRFM